MVCRRWDSKSVREGLLKNVGTTGSSFAKMKSEHNSHISPPKFQMDQKAGPLKYYRYLAN